METGALSELPCAPSTVDPYSAGGLRPGELLYSTENQWQGGMLRLPVRLQTLRSASRSDRQLRDQRATLHGRLRRIRAWGQRRSWPAGPKDSPSQHSSADRFRRWWLSRSRRLGGIFETLPLASPFCCAFLPWCGLVGLQACEWLPEAFLLATHCYRRFLLKQRQPSWRIAPP